MSALATVQFDNTNLEIIDRNGQPWLQSPQIATALGYKRSDSISRIFNRNKDEFTNDMTCTVNLAVKGFGSGNSEQDIRIFSPRGAHLIAMFARTDKAKAFRKWVLDVLDNVTQQPAIATTLSPSSQRTIQEQVATLAHENKAYAKYYGALKTHFRVGTYKDILESQLDEALQVLQGVVIVQRAIAAPAIAPVAAPINDQPNLTELLTAINEPNGASVSTDELTEFMIASMRRLQHRCNYYQSRISSKQH